MAEDAHTPLDSSSMCAVPVTYVIPAPAPPPQRKQCRICLEGEEAGRMVAPCKCTGSMQFAHSLCLVEWIHRLVDSSPKLKARCEVCDAQFNYRVTNVRIFDCEELRKNYERDKCNLRCFGMIYGLFLVGLIGLICMVAVANSVDELRRTMIPSGTTMVVYVCVIMLWIVVMVVVGILFISEYIVRQETIIADVGDYLQPPAFLKNFKIYFRR